MPRYKQKPIFIDAVEFKEGMQDGFYFTPIKSDSLIYTKTNEELETRLYLSHGKKIPFIETYYGRMKIEVGDFIVTSEDGKRKVWKAEEFKNSFSPVFESDFINNEDWTNHYNGYTAW